MRLKITIYRYYLNKYFNFYNLNFHNRASIQPAENSLLPTKKKNILLKLDNPIGYESF